MITDESMARNRFHSIITHAIIFGSANMAGLSIGCDAPWPIVFPPNLVFTEAGDCLESINRDDLSSPFKENDVWIGSRLDVATFSEWPMERTKL